MEMTLVLNASFEPIKVVDWQRAMTLWAQGKVAIVEHYEREARSVSFSFRIPSVVRLLQYVKLKRRPSVTFTRANIYARDEHTCQYCADALPASKLTFDHVVPVAQGGRRSWENLVTCCEPCNRKKGARTPREAGMTLLHQPRKPLVLPPAGAAGHPSAVPTWASYLWGHVSSAGAI